jgi:hypothetical protein
MQKQLLRVRLINVFGMAKAWQIIKLIDSKNFFFKKKVKKSKNVWYRKMKKKLFCSDFFI